MKAMSVAPRRWLRSGVRSASLHAAWHYLPIAIVLLAWQLVVEFDLVNRAFLPSFGETLSALWEMTRNGEIGFNLAVSLYRAFAGLAIGCLLGVAIGSAMAASRQADRFFGPLVATTYSLPKSSLVPLFILWFGIGDVTNILTVVLACLLPVIVSTYHGVQSVPRVMVWSARAMGTPRYAILWRILLPGALLSILTGVRIALGFCFVLTISAEMIAAKSGIGKLIFLYGENGAYAYMFGGLLAVVIVAYGADRLLLAGMHYFLRWHDSIHAARARA
jgi:ABC-type nitrate/sulfonate/bicarbonate transport system permease component